MQKKTQTYAKEFKLEAVFFHTKNVMRCASLPQTAQYPTEEQSHRAWRVLAQCVRPNAETKLRGTGQAKYQHEDI
ncbi:MAG TPA: hypothetical protein VF458_08280 [Ktedonobacteraceae bacterium]